MIKSITVTNPNGQKLKLSLTSPEESGLIVKNVNGLGPVKANVNITKASNNDISKYTSSRIDTRNIVLQLQYLPNPTIEDTRRMTYLYFPVKGKVHITVETEKVEYNSDGTQKVRTRLSGCDGYVETNEATIFAKETGCQISILCPDPFLYDETAIKSDSLYGSSVPLFEFPFGSIEGTPSLELGQDSDIPIQELVNVGDVSTGIIVDIIALGPVVNPTIYNLTTEELMKINTSVIKTLTKQDFDSGDIVRINTKRGEKSVSLIRNGKSENIISALDSYDTWINIYNGVNRMTYKAESGSKNMLVSYSFALAYEGI